MTQQTAVEWLIQQFENTFSAYIEINPDWQVIEQAKEMEKEQLKEMYLKGIENYDPTFKKKVNGPK